MTTRVSDVRRSAAATKGHLTDTRTAARWGAAILMPVGPAAVAVLRFVLPYDTPDTPGQVLDKIAVNLGAEQTVLWLEFVALFTLVPGVFAVVRLVRRGAPRLSLAAALLLVPGYLALFWGSNDLFAYVGLSSGVDRTSTARILELTAQHPSESASLTIFVLGHIAGSMLLGCALWRSRVVHPVFALAMGVSQPIHLFAAMTGNHRLDLFAWGLTTVAMAAASVAVVRTLNDEWDLPPAEARTALTALDPANVTPST